MSAGAASVLLVTGNDAVRDAARRLPVAACPVG